MNNGINWSTNQAPFSYQNPYMQMPTLQMPAPQMHVTRVSGENGVDAFQIGPNSDVLLLDETAPIVWFVQTDGAGYKTKTPYDITVHTPAPTDMQIMDDRFASIDKRLKMLEEALIDEPNH